MFLLDLFERKFSTFFVYVEIHKFIWEYFTDILHIYTFYLYYEIILMSLLVLCIHHKLQLFKNDNINIDTDKM